MDDPDENEENIDSGTVTGGFKYFFNVHPYLGKIPMLTNIFQRGWNHQPGNIAIEHQPFWWYLTVFAWNDCYLVIFRGYVSLTEGRLYKY